MRRYSGLVNRLVIGRYGDALTGGAGSAACSGFTRTNPAPCSRALQAARSARSRRSPCPHEPWDRSEYSWTANPQDRSRTCGAVTSSGTGAGAGGWPSPVPMPVLVPVTAAAGPSAPRIAVRVSALTVTSSRCESR